MRDKETDSWWSIMTSDAIGGEMSGQELQEMPLGEKTTWSDWRRRYPETLVLSVEGEEHDTTDHYADYFSSDDTFRGIVVEDKRLGAKEPVYTFHWNDVAFAVPHTRFGGGAILRVDEETRSLFLYRATEVPMFASTVALWLPKESDLSLQDALSQFMAEGGIQGAVPLSGFDTFWYSWVGINEGSRILE